MNLQSLQKLSFLDMLKSNMGEEMTEDHVPKKSQESWNSNVAWKKTMPAWSLLDLNSKDSQTNIN